MKIFITLFLTLLAPIVSANRVLILPVYTGSSGGSVTYDKFDMDIEVTKIHNTGSCRALWDDSKSFLKDDLEIMFKVHGGNTFNDDLTSKKKSNSSSISKALSTNFSVVHEDFLNPGKIFVEVMDVDHVKDDKLGSFSFDFSDAVSTFDTECVSGNVQINHTKVKETYNEFVSKVSIHDEVLYKCGSTSIIHGEYLGIYQENDSSDPNSALKLSISALDPTMDFCSGEDIYLERFVALGPANEVESLKGYSVDQIILAPYGTSMNPSKINKIYASGHVEVEIYSMYKGEISSILDTEIMKIKLLRRE